MSGPRKTSGYTLAIDPATRALHCAIFFDGFLTRTHSVKITDEELLTSRDHLRLGSLLVEKTRLDLTLNRFDLLIVEAQRWRPNSPVDPNDLIELAQVAGCATALGKEVKSFWPENWKGQLPKSIHHQRLENFFLKNGSGQEISVWRKAKNKDLRDAVGLGLFGLGIVGKGAEERWP